MDGEDDLDTHICLSCQMPIIGLDNYVYHKKFSCPAKKPVKPPPSDEASGMQQRFSEPSSLSQGLMTSSSLQQHPAAQHQLSSGGTGLQMMAPRVNTAGEVTGSNTAHVQTSTYSSTPSRFNVVDPNMVLCRSGRSSQASILPPASALITSSAVSSLSVMSQPERIHTLHHTDAIQTLSHSDPIYTDSIGTLTPTGPIHTEPIQRLSHTDPMHSSLSHQHTMMKNEAVDLQQDEAGATPSIIDFLSSLELQCRSTPKQSDERGLEDPRSMESRVPDGLKFAALLNDLNFDSDSEGFDMPSDAEDLLNFDEEDYQELNGQTPYGGKDGKGKRVPHFGKMEPGKVGKKGRNNHVGKWKPGDRPHTGGKSLRPVSIGKRHYEDPSSDEDTEAAAETNLSPTVTGGSEAGVDRSPGDITDPEGLVTDDHTYVLDDGKEVHNDSTELKCDPCDKSFSSRQALHNHIRSAKHTLLLSLPEQGRADALKDAEKKDGKKNTYSAECSSCQKTFNNKYNYARHLLSSLHAKRSKSAVLNLDPRFQRLMLRLKRFQCRVCEFFCNTGEDLMQHMNSGQHTDATEGLIGPLSCVRCKFSSSSDEQMVHHFSSETHRKTLAESDRPCVLRELRANVPCFICNKQFHSATALKRHMDARHKSRRRGRPSKSEEAYLRKSSICPVCNKDCKTKYNMGVHLRRNHTGEKPYSCDVCTKRFKDQSTLNMHYKSQRHLDNVIRNTTMTSPEKDQALKIFKTTNKGAAKTVKCKLCDFSSTENSDVRQHFIKAHGKMHMCEICGVSCITLVILQKHLETDKHKKMEQEAEAAGNVSFSCMLCSHKFYSKEKLSLHMLSHSVKDNTPKVNKKLQGVPEKFHDFVLNLPKNSKNVTSQCPECGQLLRISNIIPHLRSHGDPVSQPFKCNFCLKTFTSNSTLYRHHKSHLGIKPFECSVCNKRFKTSPQLETHQLKAHKAQMNIQPKYLCKICGQEFIQSTRYRLHMRYHENDRRFKCSHPGCPKSFVLLSSLKDHERVHTGEKPYLCDLCGFATKTNTHMNRHRRVHTGECNYECEYCTFKASHSWGLRRHMRIHIGSKPYKCPYCDYRCNCHTNLRHHVLSSKRHAGLTVYKCKFCGMGTNQAKEFQKHMIEVHSVPAEDVENICVYAGIYIKENDSRSVPEGSQVHPVREKKRRAPRSAKDKKIIEQAMEHATRLSKAAEETSRVASGPGMPHMQLLQQPPTALEEISGMYSYPANMQTEHLGNQVHLSNQATNPALFAHHGNQVLHANQVLPGGDIQSYMLIQPNPDYSTPAPVATVTLRDSDEMKHQGIQHIIEYNATELKPNFIHHE